MPIDKETAILLGKSRWWESLKSEHVVGFQLFEETLCMDFGDFHVAIERVLDRPVWTHEFASPGIDRLRDEYLGRAKPRTFEEIVNLIPKEKLILISEGEVMPSEPHTTVAPAGDASA